MALFLSVAAIFISVVMGMAGSIYTLMKSEANRNDYIVELREPHTDLGVYYRKYLKLGLDKLYGWLDNPFGEKALVTHTSLAFFYAISFFALSWVLGGSGHIGEINVFPEGLSAYERLLWTPLFACGAALIIYLYRNNEKIDSAVEKKFLNRFPNMTPKMVLWSYRLVSGVILATIISMVEGDYYVAGVALAVSVLSGPAVVFAVAVAFTGALAGAGAGAGAGAFVFAFAFACVFAVEGALALALALALAVAVAVAVAFAFVVEGAVAVAVAVAVIMLPMLVLIGTKQYFWTYFLSSALMVILFWALGSESKYVRLNPVAASYLFFFIILPFINGMMDFISSGISRALGEKIYLDHLNNKFRAFAFHFGIDFIAAVLLLLLLAFSVSFATELFDIFVAKELDLMINLPEIIENAKKDPLGGNGLWVTLMLFSTLIPTFCHFVIALGGIFSIYIIPKTWREGMADKLEKNGGLSRKWTFPILYFAARWPVSILAGSAFLWGIVWLTSSSMGHLANGLSGVAGYGIGFAHVLFAFFN